MSDPKTQQEPSMEEILASIRRIISEDGAEERPEARSAPADSPPATEAATANDDVLELTEIVGEPDTPGDDAVQDEPADVFEATEPTPKAAAPIVEDEQPFSFDEPEEDGEQPAENDRLVSDVTAAATGAALARLTADPGEGMAPPRTSWPLGDGGRTVEDLVRELLRPMLRDWLDQNLPPMVEEIVEREVQRIRRGSPRR